MSLILGEPQGAAGKGGVAWVPGAAPGGGVEGFVVEVAPGGPFH